MRFHKDASAYMKPDNWGYNTLAQFSANRGYAL
jgi:hypothetical protein